MVPVRLLEVLAAGGFLDDFALLSLPVADFDSAPVPEAWRDFPCERLRRKASIKSITLAGFFSGSAAGTG
ncbi:MAG TPA: hypothetical protein VGM27_04655, partial [Acidobacteriaceae bacterium]